MGWFGFPALLLVWRYKQTLARASGSNYSSRHFCVPWIPWLFKDHGLGSLGRKVAERQALDLSYNPDDYPPWKRRAAELAECKNLRIEEADSLSARLMAMSMTSISFRWTGFRLCFQPPGSFMQFSTHFSEYARCVQMDSRT
eukprot:667915-Amphidinium_carterae.1